MEASWAGHGDGRGTWYPGRWCAACEAAWKAARQAETVAEGQDAAGLPARYRAFRFGRHLVQGRGVAGETWEAFRARLELETEPTIGITAWNVHAAKAVRDRPRGRTVILSGPVGAGKTLLAACLANDMIERGQDVLWITEAGLWEAHRREQSAPRGSPRRIVGACLGAPLLFLDDLGSTEIVTAWHRDHMEALICGRYERGASVVITTNLPLTAPEGVDSLQALWGERVYSRLVEMTGGKRAGLPGYVELLGVDWRSDTAHAVPVAAPASTAPPSPAPAPSSSKPPRRRDARMAAANDTEPDED